MDVRALLETPHRSVHWSLVGKLCTATTTGDPEQRFAEWRKLLSWEVAAKAPHVFTEAVGHVTRLVLAGRLEATQVSQLLTALVAAPQAGRRSSAEATAVSALVRALVQLLAAGMDRLAPSPNRSARDNILRPALERNPPLWVLALQHIHDLLVPGRYGYDDGAPKQDWTMVWDNVCAFLRYAALDPTVPAWAQGRTVDMVFRTLHELACAGMGGPGHDQALAILEWATDLAADMVQPIGSAGPDPDNTFCDVDLQGRCDPHQVVLHCARAVDYLCALVVAPVAASKQAVVHRLAAAVGRLRLLAAGMSLTDLLSAEQTRQTHSPRMSGDRAALAACQLRLLRSAQHLDAQQPGSAIDSAKDAPPDALVWAAAAFQIAGATSAAEQAHLLEMVKAILASTVMAARIPGPAAALMRFPLLCVAGGGFSCDISSAALRICEDMDQMTWQGPAGSSNGTADLVLALDALAASKWAAGALPLLASNLRDYAAVHAALGAPDGAAGRPGPLGGISGPVEAIASQPLLVAPLLFAWNRGTAGPDDAAAVVPKLALAALLRLLPRFPELRMGLLPLFMYALRQPDAPAGLRQSLLLHAIPCLATTADAYATSRVVAVISGIWRRCAEGTAPQQQATSWAKRRPELLRLCCLAFRGWANIVAHNPRVWRDLKPVISQLVEAKKARKPYAAAQQPRGVSLLAEPEYEWTVLATMRDLVQRDPDRYADQILPFVYSLLAYAHEQLGAGSTALLVDTARICVEARAADVRSVWETIVLRAADRWIPLAGDASREADRALESLARFFALVGTHGEGTDSYAAFRRDVLLRYVAPTCGFAVPSPDEPDAGEPATSTRLPPPELQPPTRDCFLAALATFPVDEVLPLVSQGTPGQTIHGLLAQMSRGQQAAGAVQRTEHAGSVADLLASLMDNEVRFMRRSLLKGSSTFARVADDEDGAGDDGDASGLQRSWARSNLDRSQWVYEVLSPALARAREMYWKGGRMGAGQTSRLALATMASSVTTAEPEKDGAVDADGSCEDQSLLAGSTDSDMPGSRAQQTAARLGSLLVDVGVADHWCMRSSAVDGWQMWFARSLHDVQPAGDDGNGDTAAAAVDMLAAVLRDMLQASHIPARLESALYALAGLVRAAESVDQALGSETSARVGSMLLEMGYLPYTQPPDEFWLAEARTRNDGVLAAAVECAGQVALTNSHDTATLNQIVQFLLGGLSLPRGDQERLPPLVVQAIGRALTRLYILLADTQAAAPETYGADQLAIEAGDIRRCIERLDILQMTSGASSVGDVAIDHGSVGLALALGVMHRHWIARFINPAMAERNGTPQASQARRSVARTLALAFENLKQAENGQWSAASIPSLYYLCFVWPPRPVLQRHVELHGDLFVVTPERVWQAATRMVHRLWPAPDSEPGSAGLRNLEVVNLAEIAVAALSYHLQMTAHQSTAHSAYKQLVRQYSEWARGETGTMQLAANERSSLRANRTVALAILLGLPLHGVPETTVSNNYLPLAQRRCLPVLLGIGSVKYGSTAWLREPEANLQQSLGSLLGCSGLAAHPDHCDSDDMTGDLGSDATDGARPADGAADDADVGDVRVARIASFALGALRSQAAQAARFLLLDAQASLTAVPSAVVAGQGSAADSAPEGASADAAGDAAAASDEPKSLGHLPAPTSWCRALWECLSELSESLEDGAGATVPSVEARLAYLLEAMLRAARPFPVIDMRKVLGRIASVYVSRLRAADLVSARMPLLLLVVKVASKLSPTMHSMAQFLEDTVLQIASKVADLARAAPAAGRYIDDVVADTLPAIALACVGETELGRLLSLAGLAGSQPAVLTTPDGSDTTSDDANPGWTARGLPGCQFTRADMVRIAGSEVLYARRQLAAAVAQTVPAPSRDADAVSSRTVLASDAARMFHMMSKVAISAPRAANMCASLVAILFAGRENAAPASKHPAILVLQAQALATLAAAVAGADATVPPRELTRDAARTKIAAEVAALLRVESSAEGLPSAEERVQQWGVLGVAFSGANGSRGAELLALDARDRSDSEFGCIVASQALVLQRWLARVARGGPAASPLEKHAPWAADILSPRGAAGGWLKRTFKEWARRTAACQEPADDALLCRPIRGSLQAVARALFAARSGSRSASDAETREWAIQGLDLVILAASILGAGKGGEADQMLGAGVAYWLLPLLTGHAAALGDGADCQPGLLCAAGRELLEYVELGPAGGHRQMSQFAAQLRTRAVGLHGLAGPPSRRWLQIVLANLAVLGKVPLDDMGRAL